MLHVCTTIFDVTGKLDFFLFLGKLNKIVLFGMADIEQLKKLMYSNQIVVDHQRGIDAACFLELAESPCQ